MTKEESIEKLNNAFSIIEKAIESFPADKFFDRATNGKWSVAENAEHLFLSVKPLVGLFGKKEIMLNNWGKSKRPSKTYDEMIEWYVVSLSKTTMQPVAAVAPGQFTSREEIISNLHSIHQKFIERTAALTEEELDTFQVPHPLLGLITCREFVYFTVYHTLHHLKAIHAING